MSLTTNFAPQFEQTTSRWGGAIPGRGGRPSNAGKPPGPTRGRGGKSPKPGSGGNSAGAGSGKSGAGSEMGGIFSAISANSRCCFRCIRRLSRAFPSPDSALASRLSARLGSSSAMTATGEVSVTSKSSCSVSIASRGPSSSSGSIMISMPSSLSLTMTVAISAFCSSRRARRIEMTIVVKNSIKVKPTAAKIVIFICWEPGSGASRASNTERSSSIGPLSPESEARVRILRDPDAVESMMIPSFSIPA